MSDRYVIEALLRPAVEFNTTLVAATASYVCVAAPWAVALSPSNRMSAMYQWISASALDIR